MKPGWLKVELDAAAAERARWPVTEWTTEQARVKCPTCDGIGFVTGNVRRCLRCNGSGTAPAPQSK